MKLIPIQKNLLINPDKITSVEIMTVKGKESVLVTVDGRAIALEIDFHTFMEELTNCDKDLHKQFTAL